VPTQVLQVIVTCRLFDCILPELNPLPARHLSPTHPTLLIPSGFGPGPASPKMQTLQPSLPTEGLSPGLLDINQEATSGHPAASIPCYVQVWSPCSEFALIALDLEPLQWIQSPCSRFGALATDLEPFS
jgi:hypothetical protein